MGHAWGVDAEELLARAPRQLPLSTERPELRYEIADDLIATHGELERPLAQTVGPAVEAEDAATGQTTLGPVYRRVPGGGLVVPTGRVLVRFAEGEPVERHRDELAGAGYDIEEVLSYAPHAAWLRARSGDIADTLAGLDRLAAQPGIENVEPQMVGEVWRRD